MAWQGSSSSSSFSYKWTYDVFLSFRGKDTRTGFTGNLYKALCQRGIHTFIDDAQLRRGKEITPSLAKAIEESRIAIVVFSEYYASSRFCLEELIKIIDCIKTKGRLVLQVFYKVDPSQVGRQTRSYGEAFARYESVHYHEPGKVLKWRSALSMAANLTGYHYYGEQIISSS
ncbi:hypothetical protein L6164_002187 [Bauhinia variegata]|uniref:Uncharacterized protein n=1 Tax=Bauhinia variegata TaxID=167791 RepID=A0ACB9Q059_BAUVA|nr:hypothetical protein L6164_002187 [Bauhinia variegata]